MFNESLGKEIQFLAYSGWSPKEIEEELGLEPFSIHIHHHDDLMIGYERHIAVYKNMPGKISRPRLNKTKEQKAERKRLQAKQSYLKRKAAGSLKRTKNRGTAFFFSLSLNNLSSWHPQKNKAHTDIGSKKDK